MGIITTILYASGLMRLWVALAALLLVAIVVAICYREKIRSFLFRLTCPTVMNAVFEAWDFLEKNRNIYPKARIGGYRLSGNGSRGVLYVVNDPSLETIAEYRFRNPKRYPVYGLFKKLDGTRVSYGGKAPVTVSGLAARLRLRRNIYISEEKYGRKFQEYVKDKTPEGKWNNLLRVLGLDPQRNCPKRILSNGIVTYARPEDFTGGRVDSRERLQGTDGAEDGHERAFAEEMKDLADLTDGKEAVPRENTGKTPKKNKNKNKTN